jgi:hypothetical protein
MVSSTSAIYSKNPSPGSPRAGASSWSASVGTPHSEQHRQVASVTRQRRLMRRLRSALPMTTPLAVGELDARLQRLNWYRLVGSGTVAKGDGGEGTSLYSLGCHYRADGVRNHPRKHGAARRCGQCEMHQLRDYTGYSCLHRLPSQSRAPARDARNRSEAAPATSI